MVFVPLRAIGPVLKQPGLMETYLEVSEGWCKNKQCLENYSKAPNKYTTSKNYLLTENGTSNESTYTAFVATFFHTSPLHPQAISGMH